MAALLKGFALLARSCRMSSLNFEPHLQSEINKSSINTTALLLAQFSSAAALSRAAEEGEEERVSVLFLV